MQATFTGKAPVTCTQATVHPVQARRCCCQQRACRGSRSSRVRAVPEEAAAGSPQLFSPQFAAVFQQALERQGEEALSGPAKVTNERQPSAQEHVLQASMQDSRRNLIQLQRMKDAVEGAIEREKKQFDRLHFCYQKARDDAAYIHTMERNRSLD